MAPPSPAQVAVLPRDIVLWPGVTCICIQGHNSLVVPRGIFLQTELKFLSLVMLLSVLFCCNEQDFK